MTYLSHCALHACHLGSLGRRVRLAILLIAACATAANAEALLEQPAPTRFEAKFSLIDHTGKPVTQADYRGRWLLVFFGYTYCPDVCPTTLLTIRAVLRQLGSDAPHVQAIFITVDPERDNIKTMADYVGFYGGNIVGLTGSKSAVRDAAASYRAHFRKVENDRGPDAYLMEHQAAIYLLDRQGKLKTIFTPGSRPDSIVNTLRQLFKEEIQASEDS